MNATQPLTFNNFLWNPQGCTHSCLGKCVLVALSILFKVVTLGAPYCCCRPLAGRVAAGASVVPKQDLFPEVKMAGHLSKPYFILSYPSGKGRIVIKSAEERERFFIVEEDEDGFDSDTWSTHFYSLVQLKARLYYLNNGYKVASVMADITPECAKRGTFLLEDKKGDIYHSNVDGELVKITPQQAELLTRT